MNRRLVYFILTFVCFIFCILILILLSSQPVIRGFVGDIIVTILIYCFVKIFIDFNPLKLSVAVLVFSYLVEVLQYFNLIDIIGLGNNQIARIIIGATFDYRDLFAYTLGILIIYFIDSRMLYNKLIYGFSSK